MPMMMMMMCGDGSSDDGSSDDDVPPPIRRPRARAVPVGRQARPRAQAQSARPQPQPRQWTNDLVNPTRGRPTLVSLIVNTRLSCQHSNFLLCFSPTISCAISIDNESDNTDKTLRTWKVQRVLDYLVKRFRDAYTPRRELSVDETMLKFKGRLNIKQYAKIKPVKWGIKLFTLAESITGYVLDFLPYTGRRADTIYSKTTQTVLDVSRHYLHLGHHIFFDNYYMSVELMRVLFEKKSLCCGTVNANRVGLPGDMKKKCAAVKHLNRGSSLKRMNSDILAVTWMDTCAVNLLCNIPDCLGDDEVQRRDKRTGAELTISRPLAIALYNSYMGGVDLSDQRVSTYNRRSSPQ